MKLTFYKNSAYAYLQKTLQSQRLWRVLMKLKERESISDKRVEGKVPSQLLLFFKFNAVVAPKHCIIDIVFWKDFKFIDM
jgi:hypothetical protein